MSKPTILLIEDDEEITGLLKLQAEVSGYNLIVEKDGLNGYRAIEREKPQLIILDIMLPGMNGLDLCKKIKAHPELQQIPIMLLSIKSEEMDVLLGLELGADDYIVKPFSPKILFSRVKVILRRTQKDYKTAKPLNFGIFTFDPDRHGIKKKDQLIPLTLSEFSILNRLVASEGKVLTRNQLLDDLQSHDAFVVDRNIDVHIAALRKKLGPHFNAIETVRGIGYRFKADE